MQFKDVLVDDELKKQLVALADGNRVSHAQLFLGNSGSHSFALAIAYAQYICCTDRHDGDSCGHCHSCTMFQKLQHPDLHLIFPNCIYGEVTKDPESKLLTHYFREFIETNNYHIDYSEWVKFLKSENKQVLINIRDCATIINQNSIRAYENGYKIYVLWMAEKIQPAAANKLLKTLEEPESNTLFILLAESSDQMLPTILSRTQLVKIPPLKESVIQQQLIEDTHCSEKEAKDIAAISEGSYVRARKLSTESAELHHLLTNYNLLLKSLMAHLKNPNDLAKIDYFNIQSLFEGIIKEGKDAQKGFLKYVMRMFRNELLMNKGGNQLVKCTGEEWKVLEEYKVLFTVKNAAPLLEECNNAIYHIERNANSLLVFTDLYFKLLDNFSKR